MDILGILGGISYFNVTSFKPQCLTQVLGFKPVTPKPVHFYKRLSTRQAPLRNEEREGSFSSTSLFLAAYFHRKGASGEHEPGGLVTAEHFRMTLVARTWWQGTSEFPHRGYTNQKRKTPSMALPPPAARDSPVGGLRSWEGWLMCLREDCPRAAAGCTLLLQIA